MENNQIDIALFTIPKHGVNVPPLALPYLAAAIRAAGYTCSIRDLNIELYKATIHTSWSTIWAETSATLYKGPDFNIFVSEFYDSYLNTWAREIAQLNTRYIGISCFSYRSIPTLRLLIPKIKKLKPQIKIIVGGAPAKFYGNSLLDEKLADYVIQSEGEISIVELLGGNFDFPGILTPSNRSSPPLQIENLDSLPLPDYSGINFSLYTPGDPGGLIAQDPTYNRFGQQAGIMASRGCVRSCTFCDVESYWPNFKWRSPQNIFKEMVSLYESHGIREIYFHDSLINGNLHALQSLLSLLIKNRHKYPFILRGLAIIRNQPNSLYQQLADAGFVQLQIGIESFSEKIRKDMKKGFSNKLLEENLDAYAKVNIKIILLLMTGYPTETAQEHQENLSWLNENTKYNKKPIHRIDWGGTTLILPGSPLYNLRKNELYIDGNKDWVFINQSEINTFNQRVSRLKESETFARSIGWTVGTSYSGGEITIGDPEKEVLTNRPQDLFPFINSEENQGWENNKVRETAGYFDIR